MRFRGSTPGVLRKCRRFMWMLQIIADPARLSGVALVDFFGTRALDRRRKA